MWCIYRQTKGRQKKYSNFTIILQRSVLWDRTDHMCWYFQSIHGPFFHVNERQFHNYGESQLLIRPNKTQRWWHHRIHRMPLCSLAKCLNLWRSPINSFQMDLQQGQHLFCLRMSNYWPWLVVFMTMKRLQHINMVNFLPIQLISQESAFKIMQSCAYSCSK